MSMVQSSPKGWGHDLCLLDLLTQEKEIFRIMGTLRQNTSCWNNHALAMHILKGV